MNRYEHRRSVTARCDVKQEEKVYPDQIFDALRDEYLPQLGFAPVVGDNMTFLGKPGSAAEGVRATFTGENEERDKNFRYLLYSMFLGVILIFGILVTQFNSFRQSLIVMVTVPLSFIGVVLGMWACGFPFSLASFIGLVSLTGIVVNDAIVLVDFTNQARKRGLPLREAGQYPVSAAPGETHVHPRRLLQSVCTTRILPLAYWAGDRKSQQYNDE